MSASLTSEGHETGIDIEIHTGDESVNLSWEGTADSHGVPPRPEAVGRCTLMLSGDVDWDVFEKLRTYLPDQWSASEHHQTDRFGKG